MRGRPRHNRRGGSSETRILWHWIGRDLSSILRILLPWLTALTQLVLVLWTEEIHREEAQKCREHLEEGSFGSAGGLDLAEHRGGEGTSEAGA